MKHSKLVVSSIILVVITLIGFSTASAEMRARPARQISSVPQLLTYQGHLLDSAGEPVLDGAYSMSFSLWDAASGGVRLWGPESHSVDVSDGFFAALLGTNQALDASAFGSDTYIEIEVGGETLAPRQQLASVAFSFLADHADSADAAPWTGLTGVPAGFADDVDDVDDAVAWSEISGIVGSGANQVAVGNHNHDLVYVNDDSGEVGNADVAVDGLSPDRISGTAWTSTNDGSGSGLDADTLDGQHGVYYLDWNNQTNVPAGLADGVDDTDDTVSWSEISGIVGVGANQVAAGDHNHDARYYTETELQTSGSSSVHWNNLTDIPADLADGDDDTTYSAGTGLTLSSNTFGVTTAYRLPQTCTNGQIAEWNGSVWVCGDDDTGGSGWSLTGNAGTTPGTHFVGTTDNQALELHVNGERALRIEPATYGPNLYPNLIGGYKDNYVASGVAGATIGGGGASGFENSIASNCGTVGGGDLNTIGSNANCATIGGGVENEISSTANANQSTIGGGYGNIIMSYNATIGGGVQNFIDAPGASIGGGALNTASGEYATVPGGYSNRAIGDYSYAAGRQARASADGCFVWGDSNNADIDCNIANRWMARASGGVYFYTDSGMTTGVFVPAGGGAWSTVSDRNLKENFVAVDGQEILGLLAEIPITTWNYKAQDDAIRHIGPMAQDFYAAFGLGEDDKHISTIDTDGVALVAIQGLYQLLLERDAQITAQQQRIDDLEARITALEAAASD